MIRKIILSVLFLLFICCNGFSQFTITIHPPSADYVPYEGLTTTYKVTYTQWQPGYTFVATAINGTIINTPILDGGAPTVIKVKWDCVAGDGSVTLTETTTGTSKTLPTVIRSYIGDPLNYCNVVSPSTQNLYSGITPSNLSVAFCSPYCSASNVFYHYQWQVGEIPIGSTTIIPTIWTDIQNENNETYQPPVYLYPCIKVYRRVTTFVYPDAGGIDVPYTRYSETAVIYTFDGLNPGIISDDPSGINQTPPSGGPCYGLNYIYSWERSVDNGVSWTEIGTAINYPTGVTMPTTLTIIRRKVTCAWVVGYSNPLYFNTPPLIPGSIDYNGPNTLAYNSVPDIIQFPASGSICNAGDYIYTWERSINNSGWVPIGPNGVSNINYPAGASLVANTRIRRKAKCVISNIYQEAYSNILSYTIFGFTPTTNPENLNYVRTKSILIPGIGSEPQLENLVIGEQIQETEYFDGLGRKIQTVGKQSSPLQKDMVSINEYDQSGLESINRLPFVSNILLMGNIDDDGNYKPNAVAQQNAFYSGSNSPIFNQGETMFYSQMDFESSPLNRALKSFAAGNSWVGSRGSANEKSVQFQYLLNTKAGDAVRIFKVNSSNLPESVDTYNDGELFKSITFDESSHQIVEFKDKTGNIILKKVQLANTVTDGHSGWLCTYYIYDDFNLLRFVLPPKATELYLSGTAIVNIIDELCFSYEYDKQKRMIMKHLPGADKVWMVYDYRNRLIMVQDGNMATPPTSSLKKWLVTEYDLVNRPVRTGLLSDNNTYTYHAFQASQINSSYPNVSTNYEVLTETYYDSYSWTSGTPMPSTIDASNFNSYFEAANQSPLYASQLTADYNSKTLVTGAKTKVLGTINQFEYNINFYDERGRLIQTQSTNLTGGKNITTSQYDFSNKILRSLATQQVISVGNLQKHLVYSAMTYDHVGRLLKISKYVKSTVNSHDIGSLPRKILVEKSYDELGRLKNKKLGQKLGTINELEKLTYDYNIRGWLLGMNRDYLNAPGQGNSKFAFELGFDKMNNSTGRNFLNQQFNSNITGLVWKSDGDDIRRKYDFSYDNSNRLMKGDFEQQNADDYLWNKNKVNFSMYMGNGINPLSAYDANGNILAMTQYGLKFGQDPNIPIDELAYSYVLTPGGNSNRNQLQQVIDFKNVPDSKLGDFKYDPSTKTNIDYSYDKNGNLKTDLNKSIINYTGTEGIIYNHLNLSTTIFIKKDGSSNKGTINYTYDAKGHKLNKIVTEYNASVKFNNTTYTSNIITTTNYIGAIVYETKIYTNINLASLQYHNKLQYISHEEGKIRLDPGDYTATPPVYGKFNYDYFITDHLGNVRMVITDEENQDMYPAATMEDASAPTEELFYSGLSQARQSLPLGYPQNSPPNNNRVARTNGQYGSGPKIGPGIILKVMAGDKFNAQVNSWYKMNSANPPHAPNGIGSELLDALTGGVGNLAGSKVTPFELDQAGVFVPGVSNFLQDQTTLGDPARPWAFLNWILFDENFNYVGNSSSFEQVPPESYYNNGSIPNNRTKLHVQTDKAINTNGYLYVYVSNETPDVDVFFDNLQVTHIKGPLLEENHYYPFGLTMAGISSKRVGTMENKIKYNGKELQSKEFSDESGLDWTDYGARMYDNQIGRWHVTDGYSEKTFALTPYNYGLNNPNSNIDVGGKWSVSNHYRLTRDALKDVGSLSSTQIALLSHYTSLWADHPDNIGLGANNIANPFLPMSYKSDIDYSGTAKSQTEAWSPGSPGHGSEYNYNIWHSMRSPEEAKQNLISKQDAMQRGMEFGWSKVFESAKWGQLYTFNKDEPGIQLFGQGIHALQDAFAHRGVDHGEHLLRKDQWPSLVEGGSSDYSKAKKITQSAVLVHRLMSGDTDGLSNKSFTIYTDGMSSGQIQDILEKLSKLILNNTKGKMDKLK